MQWQAERMQQLDPANMERAMRAMFGLGSYLEQSGLEASLLDLVKTRASQINGCAYCLDMHTKDARARGESEQRLTCSTPGARAPFTASGNARRCAGPRPSRWLPMTVSRTPSMRKCGSRSATMSSSR